MAYQPQSWLHELGKTILQYLAVGTVSIPFGLVYALLVILGWDHWVVAVVLLGGSFFVARFAWEIIEKRFSATSSEVVHQAIFVSSGTRIKMLHLSLFRETEARSHEALEGLQESIWQVLSDLINVSEIKLEISKQDVVGESAPSINYFTLAPEPRRATDHNTETNAKIAGASETILLVA